MFRTLDNKSIRILRLAVLPSRRLNGSFVAGGADVGVGVSVDVDVDVDVDGVRHAEPSSVDEEGPEFDAKRRKNRRSMGP